MSRRFRRWLLWSLPFLAVEGTMRAAGICGRLPRGLEQKSSIRGLSYELAPGAELKWNGFCLPIPESTISISTQGLRDRVYPETKPPGVRRIAAIGDSVAFGLGVDEPRTFLHLWEERANAQDLALEVINLAVPGYGLTEYPVVAASRAPTFHADEVWLFLIANDLRPTRDWGAADDLLKLPMLLSYTARGVFFASAFAAEVFREGAAPESFHSMEFVRSSFESLAGSSEEHGWSVAVVWTERPRRFVDRVRGESERLGFRFLDAGEWISRWPGSEVELPDRHFNVAGHERVAEFLFLNTR